MNITSAAWGKAILSMPFGFDLAQGGGFMHGGALVSLADTAVVMALKSIVPPETPFVTASLETKFLRPVEKGTVTAKAEIHQIDGRKFRGEALVIDDEKQPVLAFSSIFKIMKRPDVDPVFIPELTPENVSQRLSMGETFVLNIVAAWCSDCTERQRPRLPAFIRRLATERMPLFQMTVQQEKMRFISTEHEKMTEYFGGHGYPRTVLILNGEVRSADNVEIVDEEELIRLADAFIAEAASAGQRLNP
ncbi:MULTISPECIES: PaaI family thioesterase [Desulfococcus]|jgi:uncharacterized protein (TIGR00369 family)|nr:PaaI family thioesterase [Desulfococcus multivorans]MDX9817868.1 PaaI family thioesterase [Desulfococcus multivorans]